jgi:ketopantoate reductase
LFGATGQYIYNYRDARPQPTKEETVKNSWLNSRWSPVKVLTDTEYDEMLQEKKLRLDARIALIDENIAVLREEEKRMAEQPKESVKESVDSTLK